MPDIPDLLAAAVADLGGVHRDGQEAMSIAVAEAMESEEHLAVQAGTGTGKSMAYLVAALRHAAITGTSVVVSTATLALQNQLVARDLPRVTKALAPHLPIEPTYAILKGRGNYLCRHRLLSSPADTTAELDLFDDGASPSPSTGPTSWLGKEITRLHDWAQDTETGDRDDLPRGVSDVAWRQVSVSARECLGSLCPEAAECFAEAAREAAAQAHVVVTNHALLAIDAMTDAQILPAHDVVIIDEAHELADRVTAVNTAELTATGVSAAARRAAKHAARSAVERLEEVADGLALVLAEAPEGRWDSLPEEIADAIVAVQHAAAHCRQAISQAKRTENDSDPEVSSARQQAAVALDDIGESTERILESFQHPVAERREIVWLSVDRRGGRTVHVAPLSVAGLLRTKLFGESTVILTSATLTTGGNFAALAAAWGLPAAAESSGSARTNAASASTELIPGSGAEASGTVDPVHLRWRGLDVGSPFNYRTNAILYVAEHLPEPGRDGAAPETNAEMVSLIKAAGGRTLGLFSSMRGAKAAAEHLRAELDTPVLLQGEDSMPNLVRRFSAEPETTLVGTLTLWQGVDVPGSSLSLVIIDRIPFPRPNDPLLSARQKAISSRGGNGFMAISVNHAALLLAQGVGRLLRSTTDRGVVAILDPRLSTKSYGRYLQASLPPFWPTSNGDVVRSALARLHASSASPDTPET